MLPLIPELIHKPDQLKILLFPFCGSWQGVEFQKNKSTTDVIDEGEKIGHATFAALGKTHANTSYRLPRGRVPHSSNVSSDGVCISFYSRAQPPPPQIGPLTSRKSAPGGLKGMPVFSGDLTSRWFLRPLAGPEGVLERWRQRGGEGLGSKELESTDVIRGGRID